MTKPEPLKGKWKQPNHIIGNQSYMMLVSEARRDVAAAVEWLKNEIRTEKNDDRDYCGCCDANNFLLELIDEAFADIVEKKEEGK